MKTNLLTKQMFLSDFRALARRICGAGLAPVGPTCRSAWTRGSASLPGSKAQGAVTVLGLLTLCLFGFLLPARGQDPRLTNINYPMDTNVSVGATVSFRVYASSTNPPMTYQWQHDGTNMLATATDLLVITNVTVAHAGGYTAWITNASGGYTNTRTATLAVDPTFVKIMTGPVVNDLFDSFFGTWGDYDGDGLLDLAVAGGGENPTGAGVQLYHNKGNSEFTRVLTGSLPADQARLFGGIWADIDNDGDFDWWPVTWPQSPYFHANDGLGNFKRISTAVLVPGGRWLPGYASAIGDYDQDGFLDVAMCNGVGTGVSGPDYLLRNQSQGTFETVTNTVWSQIDTTEEMVTWVDFNEDGFTDLFSLGIPNRLLQNMGHGTFQEIFNDPLVEGTGLYQLDGTWVDFDNDGHFEVLLGRYTSLYEVYRYAGGSSFTRSVLLPFTDMLASNSDGSSWGDFDNDGDLDLFVGINIAGTGLTNSNNRLFLNNGDGTFTQIFSGSLVNDGGHSCSSAWADFDNDGFLDLFVANGGNYGVEKNFLYRNNLKNLGNTNHWLKVSLKGVAANRSGVGAKVRVEATIQGKTYWQLRQITAGQADNGLLAHFGLGDATNVTTLRIEWPSGIVQELQNVAANQFLPPVVESQSYSPTNPRPAFIGATKDASGSQLSFTEPATGARYLLEASTDLVTWTKLMARTSIGVTTNYTDTRATNYPSRFYRLQVP